jgi:hypothetical protein
MKWGSKHRRAMPGDVQVVDRSRRWVQSAIAALLGALLVGLVHLAFAGGAPVEEDHVVIRGCRLPDANGAMTVFVMEDNKLKCWRWR